MFAIVAGGFAGFIVNRTMARTRSKARQFLDRPPPIPDLIKVSVGFRRHRLESRAIPELLPPTTHLLTLSR